MIAPAYAQTASGDAGGFFGAILPLILIGVVFYFFLIRPQQKRIKEHQELVKGIRRGDSVVTQGGLVGRVSKVIDDREVEFEIADGVRVRLVKACVTEVRAKSESSSSDS